MPTILPELQRKRSTQDQARPAVRTASATSPKMPTGKSFMQSWLQMLVPGIGTLRGRLSRIQKSMLTELSLVSTAPLHEEVLARQIVQAEDAETLWELRHALSAAIDNVHGDVVARQKMTEISFMFAGLLHRPMGRRDAPSGENVVRLQPRPASSSKRA